MTNQFLDKILKKRNVSLATSSPLINAFNQSYSGGDLNETISNVHLYKGGEEETKEPQENLQKEVSKKKTSILTKIKNAPKNAIYSAKSGLKSAVNYVTGTSTEEDKIKKLAEDITDSFQQAIYKIDLKAQLKEIDLQKISKLVIEKPVNLNFGGGFLIFGPDFKITSMIHIFNKNNEPFYFEKNFNSHIEPNVINEGVKSEQKYTVKQNVKSITDIIK
jgi:hypothetical protein